MSGGAIPGATVRAARAEDVPALVELRALMFAAMGVREVGEWRSSSARWFADRLESPGFRFAVVEAGGRVVAGATGTLRDIGPGPGVPDGRDVLVTNVCTVPDARRRGYAGAAVGAVVEWARALGVTRVELVATAEGQPLYRAAGFREDPNTVMRLRVDTRWAVGEAR